MEYELIRSKRRTIAIQIKNGKLIVRAPYLTSRAKIDSFVRQKEDWIRKHLERFQPERNDPGQTESLTDEEIRLLILRAKEVIPQRTAFYAEQIGVTYGRITIRAQKTRWGSCSQKGNLNFNCLLMLTPPEVLDSVVVHELCHRREMNHSQRFYSLVHRYYPDYDSCRKWLRNEGIFLFRRLDNR